MDIEELPGRLRSRIIQSGRISGYEIARLRMTEQLISETVSTSGVTRTKTASGEKRCD